MMKRFVRARTVAPAAAARADRTHIVSITLMCCALLLAACGAGETAGRPTTAAPTTVPTAETLITNDASEGGVETTEQGQSAETGLPGDNESPADEGGLETDLPRSNQSEAEGAEGISFSEIADNPDQWVGKQVTVRGNLDDMVGQRSFTLTEPGLGADSFLVIAKGADTIPMEEPVFGTQGAGADEWVQVTGTVQRYDLPAIEQDVGADLLDDLFEAFTQEDLVIVASSINVIGDQALPGQQDGETAQTGDQVGAGADGMASPLTIAQIVENPDRYIGQRITVTGDAEEMIGSRAFKLDEDDALAGGIDNDLLVIGATATEPQFDNGILNEEVTVSGTLRLFNGDELGTDVGYDLDANLFTDWDGKPVLVADSDVVIAAE